MNYTVSSIFIFLSLTFLSCKKHDTETMNTIKLDIPFDALIDQDYYLFDTISINGSNIYNKIRVNVSHVVDHRSTQCSASTGGVAYIYSTIRLNSDTYQDTLNMPGCVGNQQWDTMNVNAPKYRFGQYRIFLLKLDPYDTIPNLQDSYKVKYVLKRN